MTFKKYIKEMQTVGASLSNEQILELGESAQKKFGINKDILVLFLLSGREDFVNWMYDQASLKILKNK